MANTIEEKLKQAWHGERRFIHLRGAFRFLVWLIVMIVLDFVIDWGILFKTRANVNVTLLLVVINVVVLGWVLWHEWLRHLKPYNPLMVALEVESRHPELSSTLVSYTQIEDVKKNQPNVSPELVAAMRDQAVTWTRPLDFREIVDFGQLKLLFAVVVGLLLFFGALSFQWSDEMGIMFQRLAGADVKYPTETQIIEVKSDTTVKIGDSAEVIARVTGYPPEDGRIYIKPADSDAAWKLLPMAKLPADPGAKENVYRRQLKALTADMLFYVRVYDAEEEAEKRIRRIRVVPAPQIEKTEITLKYPPYMNRDPDQSDQMALEVPEGTEIQWQLTCESPVKSMQVIVGDETIDATVDETGKVVTFERDADDSFTYTFNWTVSESGKEFEYDHVQYNVRVVADTVPEIDLVEPSRGGLASVAKQQKMFVRANDDHGLSKAWLVYTISGSSEEHRVAIHDFKGARGGNFPYQWDLKESIESLEPGMLVTFAVEVGDLHPSEDMHLRRSASRQLSIVDNDRYKQWIDTQLAAVQEQLKRVESAELESSKEVKQIKAQEGPEE